MNQAKLLQIQIIEYQAYSLVCFGFPFPCLDTLDLRQSTFAQWRFEQCQTSCFVDTKLLDTIHLEHDNMVQRCIRATILASDTCRYLQYKELRCLQHHIFDKIWWVLRRGVYVWLPLTTHIYIRMCRFSGTSPICARSRRCCCIDKSQSKGVRGQQLSPSVHAALNLVAKTPEAHVFTRGTKGYKWCIFSQLAWTNWPPTSMKSVKMLEFQQGLK